MIVKITNKFKIIIKIAYTQTMFPWQKKSTKKWVTAIMSRDETAIAHLLKNGYNPNQDDNFALTMIVESGDAELFRFLSKDARFGQGVFLIGFFQNAVSKGHTELVKMFMSIFKVNPADWGNKAIKTTCVKNWPEILDIFLKDQRIDPNHIQLQPFEVNDFHENYLLNIATELGHEKIVQRLLLDNRFDPRKENQKVFLTACEKGWYKIVKVLLKDGRINPLDRYNLAIKLAILHKQKKVLKVLFDNDRIKKFFYEKNQSAKTKSKPHVYQEVPIEPNIGYDILKLADITMEDIIGIVEKDDIVKIEDIVDIVDIVDIEDEEDSGPEALPAKDVALPAKDVAVHTYDEAPPRKFLVPTSRGTPLSNNDDVPTNSEAVHIYDEAPPRKFLVPTSKKLVDPTYEDSSSVIHPKESVEPTSEDLFSSYSNS